MILVVPYGHAMVKMTACLYRYASKNVKTLFPLPLLRWLSWLSTNTNQQKTGTIQWRSQKLRLLLRMPLTKYRHSNVELICYECWCARLMPHDCGVYQHFSTHIIFSTVNFFCYILVPIMRPHLVTCNGFLRLVITCHLYVLCRLSRETCTKCVSSLWQKT